MHIPIKQTKKLISLLYKKFLDIIAPPHCAHCKTFLDERVPLCTKCLKQIMPIASTNVIMTATKSIKVFALGDYKSPLKELIVQKHWSNRVASLQLGQLLWEHTYIKHQTFDVIIPVPLHWTRFAWRGFNQAQEIAQVISTESEKPLIDCLQRIKQTPFQAQLSQQERKENVCSVFSLKKDTEHALKNKHILLVDDLLTTGATVRSAAKVLFKYKPASITLLVASRVV